MKKLYTLAIVLLLANFAMADTDLATLVGHGVKHAAHATKVVAVAVGHAGKKVGHGTKKFFSDGSGPIQTCRPGTNCDPVV